jgi:hypothetical protein
MNELMALGLYLIGVGVSMHIGDALKAREKEKEA